jgi:hypothetical protein
MGAGGWARRRALPRAGAPRGADAVKNAAQGCGSALARFAPGSRRGLALHFLTAAPVRGACPPHNEDSRRRATGVPRGCARRDGCLAGAPLRSHGPGHNDGDDANERRCHAGATWRAARQEAQAWPRCE